MSETDGVAEPGALDNDDNDGLLSRIRLIEDQPLESRAVAFAQLHAELQSALEGSDQHS